MKLSSSLTEVVTLVSGQLFRTSTSSDFATLFVGVIDPATHRMNYINCGHNPPVLVRNDGRLEHLEASGTMIGAFDHCAWGECEVELQPGDMFLVFSDGVTEADRGDEQYSDERLEDALRRLTAAGPKELVDTIMSEVDDFLQAAPRSDDITMLAVKRTT